MADGEDVITPIVEYMDDEKDPENFLKVGLDIPGLKKKAMSQVAKNADIKFEYDERSFSVWVTVTEPKQTKKYHFAVKQLPEPIRADPGCCFTKVKRKEEVLVYLQKERKGRWARMLSSTGLETWTEETTTSEKT